MLKYTKVEKRQKLSKYNLCLRPLEYYEYYAASMNLSSLRFHFPLLLSNLYILWITAKKESV